jgi:hypothetical protein
MNRPGKSGGGSLTVAGAFRATRWTRRHCWTAAAIVEEDLVSRPGLR